MVKRVDLEDFREFAEAKVCPAVEEHLRCGRMKGHDGPHYDLNTGIRWQRKCGHPDSPQPRE